MKKLLLILMLLLMSATPAFSSEKDQDSDVTAVNIDGRWSGMHEGATVTFDFKTEGKKLYGNTADRGDNNTEIRNGKIKKGKISFEVPINQGGVKLNQLYKGTIKSDNEIELTVRTKSRGPREKGFGEGGVSQHKTGFGGGLSGFAGVTQESIPFVLKRVVEQ